LSIFRKSVAEIQVLFKSDKRKKSGTEHEDLRTFTISRWIIIKI